MPEWLLTGIAIAWAVVSTVVAWAYASGRFSGGIAQTLSALTAKVEEMKTQQSSRVHLNDFASLTQRVEELCDTVDGKADVSRVVTEVELLKSIEECRHVLRGEFDAKLARCLSRDVYVAQHELLSREVDRLMRKVFNGGANLT